jgi:hypothetical protein
MRDRESIVLPLRVPRQEEPFLVEGGDCGACVLSGVIGRPVPEVYDLVDKTKQTRLGKPHSISYWDMRNFLEQNEGDLFAESITRHPMWMPYDGWALTFGNPGHMQSMGWLPYVRMGFRAGFYGLALVDQKKAGPTGAGPNHWVMVCGYRQRLEGNTFHQELLISNSARSQPAEEWVGVIDFLRSWGGFNLFLVRPRP